MRPWLYSIVGQRTPCCAGEAEKRSQTDGCVSWPYLYDIAHVESMSRYAGFFFICQNNNWVKIFAYIVLLSRKVCCAKQGYIILNQFNQFSLLYHLDNPINFRVKQFIVLHKADIFPDIIMNFFRNGCLFSADKVDRC